MSTNIEGNGDIGNIMKLANLLVVVILFVHGAPVVATANDDGANNTVTLYFGEVWQGSSLEPCVYLRNTSSTPARIRMVQLPHASARFPDLTLKAGEEVVRPLPPVNTADFAGPIKKTFWLLVEPPVVLEVALQESCGEQ